MKKILLLVLLAILAGCSQTKMKYGQGGVNACQFVKEQVPELRDNIESIEVIGEDTLLSEVSLSFADGLLSQKCTAYIKNEISKEELENTIDSIKQVLDDIELSWVHSDFMNNSLKKKSEYASMWRKVFKVKVTMKDGVIKEPRVMMDKDGITPRIIERDVQREIERLSNRIFESREILWRY